MLRNSSSDSLFILFFISFLSFFGLPNNWESGEESRLNKFKGRVTRWDVLFILPASVPWSFGRLSRSDLVQAKLKAEGKIG